MLPSNLNCSFKAIRQVLKLVTLAFKVKLAFKLEHFKKNLTVFNYTFKLELCTDHLLV